MKSMSLKESIKGYFESVPQEDRKKWLILLCLSVVLVSCVKTVISISVKRNKAQTEWTESDAQQKLDELQRLIGETEIVFSAKHDSMMSRINWVDSVNDMKNETGTETRQ